MRVWLRYNAQYSYLSRYAASHRVCYTPKFVINVFVIGGSDCIYIKYKKHLKMNKEIGMILPKKRVNTSGVGESNNYYENIYNIYTSLQQHSLTIPIDSTH